MNQRELILSSDAHKKRLRAAFATVVGNSLEWFDFAVYAFFATVIAKNFFPAGDENTALLGTFAAFGIGFVARPLGAIFFGRLGDTKGRKLALLIAMPLMGMGTLLMAALPTYATIGIAAPFLLVLGRLVQGFSAGGEMGNAIAFLVEWAPPKRRAFYGSLQQCSTIGGTLVGSAMAAYLTSTFTPEALESWGWRIPFLIGGLIIAPLGFFLRTKVEETPIFEHATDKAPVRGEAGSQKSSWVMGATTTGLAIVWTVSYYVFLNYLPSFLPKHSAITAGQALWANTAGLTVMMLAIPVWGILSDRIGRKPLMLVAAALLVALPYPLFTLLVGSSSMLATTLVMILAGLVIAVFAGVCPAAMSELFPTEHRTTGMSVGYGLATAVFGGFAPFISTWLIGATGSPLSPTYYVMGAAAISLLVILTLKETAHAPLR